VSPESAVAEQVTYWVSQGIQNAQLKLEGFGAEPVEVNISLKGQEAQIDFRTDQPEVRQMLEGALTQLKETLAREGLVLSGVSVGSSGQEGAGAQDRRQQPNARQTTVVVNEAGSTVSLQRASPAAGRALDIFV
jgi:flagellar hook-length control protein FliK